MRLAELTLLYAIVGAGCAAAALVRGRGSRAARAGDAVLLFGLWPLYGPFLLLSLRGEDHGAEGREVAFLVALRRAAATPLGRLLPDERTVRALGQRLRVAAAKVAEIDALLGRPEFSADDALARQRELTARGASDTVLATAGSRVQNIRRLQAMRDRFRRELDEVNELLCQLTTQAEVVRLAGAPDASSEELCREIVNRVEGLDQMLDDDPHAL
ncbi:MAG TPA: hypothetical protein VGQ83_10245 [Polyangia bacterium]